MKERFRLCNKPTNTHVLPHTFYTRRVRSVDGVTTAWYQ